MEGKDAEKSKVKQEADYAFDPISATADQWAIYLLNAKNFEKNFTQGEYPFKTFASTVLEKVRSAGTPSSVVETAVQVVLDRWDEIAASEGFFREINPIEFVATLADESSIDIVKRLWTDVPQDSLLLQKGLRNVAEGLGVNIPLDQEGLENLYADHFDLYSFTALEIMLMRGQVERASVLFENSAHLYSKGNDPVMLDGLVGLGLPAKSAKKWLDQSVNKPNTTGENPYKFHYEEALDRWGHKEETT